MTNQQTFEQVQEIGKHLVEIEGFLHAVAFAQANQYKLIAKRMSGLTATEREILTTSAQKCLNDLEKLSLLRKQFAKEVEVFSKL